MKKKPNIFALCMCLLSLICIIGYVFLMFEEITATRVCFMITDIFLTFYWGRLYLLSKNDEG